MGSICSKNNKNDDKGLEEDPGLTQEEMQELQYDLKQTGFPEEPVFKTIDESHKVKDLIGAKDIKNEYLKLIFEGKTTEVIHELQRVRIEVQKKWSLAYEHDLLIAFWLAIHKENIFVAKNLIDYDPSLRYICTLAMKRKREKKPKKKSKKEKRGARLNSAIPQKQPSEPHRPIQESKAFEQQHEGGNISFAQMDPQPKKFGDLPKKQTREPSAKPNQAINFFGKGNSPRVNDVGLDDEPEAVFMEGGEVNEFMIQHDSELDMRGSQPDEGSEDEGQDEDEDYNSEDEEEYDEEEDDDDWNKEPPADDAEVSEPDMDEDDDEDDEEAPSGVPMGSEFEGKKIEEKKAPPITLEDPDLHLYLEKQGVTGLDIENIKVETIYQIRKIKVGLQLRFPYLMANIIKILLFREEIPLACYLTAYYEIALDEIMIKQAIDCDHYLWLNYVWAFNKNFFGDSKNRTMVNLHTLFDYINEMCKKYNESGRSDKPQGMRSATEIAKVCMWKLPYKLTEEQEEALAEQRLANKDNNQDEEEEEEEDNILKALLSHMEDQLALDFMGTYSKFLNKDLFLHSLEKNNKQFIQESLCNGAFDKQIFKEKEVVKQIIEYMNVGSKTNFLLNILILTDISVWKNQQLIELIEMFRNFTEETTLENNRLLLSYNPMMSIALSAELLMNIANSRKRFENECNGLKDELLELGKMYNSKIDDEEYFEGLIMDVDYQNRTVLKIITSCKFEALMSEEDPKAENIMNNIYVGKEANQCDGNIYGFSTFMHILTSKHKKQAEESKDGESRPVHNFLKMITIDFDYKLDVDYNFQHRYRARAINFYFLKELVLGFLTCIISLWAYFDYLDRFRGEDRYMETTMGDGGQPSTEVNFDSESYDFAVLSTRHQYLSDETREQDFRAKFSDYKSWGFILFTISAMLTFQFILRMIFNLFKSPDVNLLVLDKYLNIDVIFAAANAVGFWYISTQNYEVLLEDSKKDTIDYLVCLVLTLAWGRFFMLFLVIPSVSKMLQTLVAMLIDVGPFGFIMACYVVIATQLFCTQYQDINIESFGDLFKTFSKVFDTALAAYDYNGADKQEIIYSAIMIVNLFLLNILLLNFMVAILSTTYSLMLESGSFMYKCSLYEYCERFMIAFQEIEYGELVIHAPPINMMCLFLLPAAPFKKIFPKVSKFFSYFVFWMENIAFVAGFLCFEVVLLPLIFFYSYLNIMISSTSMLSMLLNALIWTFFGLVILLILCTYDVWNLLLILYQHDGCKASRPENQQANEEEEGMCDEKQIDVYNDLRVNVIKMYHDIKREALKGDDDEEEEEVKIDDNFDVLKMLDEDEELELEPGIFSVKLSAIHEYWRQSKARKPEEDEDDPKVKEIKSPEPVPPEPAPEEEEKKEGEGQPGDARSGAGQPADEPAVQEEEKQLELLDDEEQRAAYPEDEDEEVQNLLNQFLIGSESSFLDTIDMVLMLKALPSKIVNYNLKQMKLFNFSILQNSLIAFQNADQVNAFEYFDEKNKDRVQKIRQCILEQKDDLVNVQELMLKIKELVQKNTDILEDYEEMWTHMKETKKVREEAAKRKAMMKDEVKEVTTKPKKRRPAH